MQALQNLVVALGWRWARNFAGAAILSMLIWSFLPAVPAFARPLPRVLAILAVFAVFGGATALLGWRARRRARAVERTVAGENGAAATEQGLATAEVAALRTRLREAMAALRKRGVRRLYELPWYVVIGPPGAGKTTALRHSGLHFPVETDAADPIGGVGGTRLCDWWFSEEAVLIDTAGRYTTQDSNREVDRAGWLGFLDLLRRARPRQPVNGAIVVIALPDLLEATDAQRMAHARAVRLRIDELTERLRVRIPVYLAISKMDRLAGFDLFFETLDAAARDQVWGVTFTLREDAGAFPALLRELLARIDARLIDRLQAERGFDRRALLSGFPLQVASIEAVLTDFVAATFSGSRMDPAPFLRGVYLTSATQSGTPFDRLTGMLARSFEIEQRQAASLRPTAARVYFVNRMMREVILGETPLVATTPGRFRRRKFLRLGALAAVVLLTLVGLGLIWGADVQARVAVASKDDAFASYRHAVDAFPSGTVSAHDDLPQVVALLDQAASLTDEPRQGLGGLLGLSTRPALVAAGSSAYDDALDHLLYPRLVWRLEAQMRADMQDASRLYDATRVYLLLGGDGPHEPEVIRRWIEADWAARFPGSLNAALRARLARHLDALLAEPLPSSQLPLDGALVAEARTAFGHVTPAERIYDRLRAADEDADALGWSPAMAVGSAADSTFRRRSLAPLTAGIPRFLTGAAFADVMRHDLPPAARQVADESWVVGRDPDIATGGASVVALESEVAQLWAADAGAAWQALLDDLELVPIGDRQHAENTLYLLSSPQSPLRDMLASIAHALLIGRLPPGDPSAPVAAAWNARWASIFALVGLNDGGSPAPPGPPPIDGILRLIGNLDNELATGNTQPTALPVVAGQSADPAALLRAEASRQPSPLAQWLREIADAGSATLGADVREAASGAYHQANGPEDSCQALVRGHYPFDPNSTDDASIADFTRVMAPGGALDAYFQKNVAPYVDTGTTPWRLHPAGGVAPPFAATALAPFERAAAIRQAFFPAGGAPMLYLTLRLSAPDGTSLHLGNSTVTPNTPASLTWPGEDGLTPASLRRTAKGHSTDAPVEQGPWAFFRLLADGSPAPDAGTDPNTRRVAFGTGTSSALLSVGTGSDQAGADPLDPALLAGFACPHVP